MAKLENVDHAIELGGLAFRLLDGCVGLFDESGVVLGHFVRLADGDGNFVDGRSLFAASGLFPV